MNTIKDTAKDIKKAIQPYERYIVIAALLLIIDHFLLKGKMRHKIQELGATLANKFIAILDGFINKIGGDSK